MAFFSDDEVFSDNIPVKRKAFTDDEVFGQPERTLKGTVQDVGAVVAGGAKGAQDAIVGLANIPTLGQAGRAAELVGLNEVYDDPRESERALSEHYQQKAAGKLAWKPESPYSDAQQYAQRQVSEAEGVGGKLKAALTHPSTIATAIGESIPTMLAGGLVGRALSAGAPVISPVVGAAIGEGVLGAGSAAEQIRQESQEGNLSPKQSGMAVASGVGTGIFGYVGGKLANKLGFEDADTLIASGFQRAAKKAVDGGAEKGFAQSSAEVAGRIIGGGFSEGIFEELPQSIQEQLWQNAATGKPLMEGVDEAAVMGALSGFAMGGAINALPKASQEQQSTDPQPAAEGGNHSVSQTTSGPVGKALSTLGWIHNAGQQDQGQAQWLQQRASALDYNQEKNKPTETGTEQQAIDPNQQKNNLMTMLVDQYQEGRPMGWLNHDPMGEDKSVDALPKPEPGVTMRPAEDVYSPYSPELSQQSKVKSLPAPPWMHSSTTPVNDDDTASWLQQRAESRQYNLDKNTSIQREKAAERAEKQAALEERKDPNFKAKQDFNESYEAMGTVPESQGNISEEEAAKFAKKVEFQRQAQRKQSLAKILEKREQDADAALKNKSIPDAVRNNAATRVAEVVKSDPVYAHMAEAKKRGKINLEAMNDGYDAVTIGIINKRYPGLFSKVGTVNPDEFANEKGYQSLDDMVNRFSEARTQKELMGQLMGEELDLWNNAASQEGDYFLAQAERAQGAEWAGAGKPATKRIGAVYPAPTEAVDSLVRIMGKRPDLVTEDDIDHWTFTAEQRAKLRQAYNQAHAEELRPLRGATGVSNTLETPQASNPDDFVRDQKVRDGAQATVKESLTVQPKKTLRQVLAERKRERAALEMKAHDAATSPENDKPEPSQAQKEAGNYAMGHVNLHGMDISIENPQGSERKGVDPQGKPWSVKMQHHYGYIKGTIGPDKDHVDIFIGPKTESEKVFVVDQVDPNTGKFDEPKVVVGAEGEQEARDIYLSNYEKGWKGTGNITEMSLDQFKAWAFDKKSSVKPAAEFGSSNAPTTDVPEIDFGNIPEDFSDRETWFNELYQRKRQIKDDLDKQVSRAVKTGKVEGEALYDLVGRLNESIADLKELVEWKSKGLRPESAPSFIASSGGSVSQNARNETQDNLPLTGETQQSVEEELAATSDEELTSMLDDVFGEKPAKEKPAKAPSETKAPKKTLNQRREQRKKETPREKFIREIETRGAARDLEGNGFWVVPSPANDDSFLVQQVDADGNRTTIGKPIDGFSRQEAMDRALQAAHLVEEKISSSTKTAKQITKEGGIAALEGVKSALEGLNQLFGGKNRLGSGLAFDEETYAQAKPHFVQAWDHAKQAGYSLKELIQYFHDQFGKTIRPYLEKFLADVKGGNLTTGEQATTVNQGDNKKEWGPATVELSSKLYDLYNEEGWGFNSITHARNLVTSRFGDVLPDNESGAFRKAVDEAIEGAVVRISRDVVKNGKGAGLSGKQIFDELVTLYEIQPKLGTRTSESVRNQAYSTPAPIAYLANLLGGMTGRRGQIVLEPTAGTGMLTISADLDSVIANELNPDRVAFLEEMGIANVISGDALDINGYPPADVVMANPPFGTVTLENGTTKKFNVNGFETTAIDHAISLHALSLMDDSGSAVLIIGGANKLTSQEDKAKKHYGGLGRRRFFHHLYSNYNVTDHFTIAGELYEKQGAGWPIDVIVIKGKGESTKATPDFIAPPIYSSFEEIGSRLNEIQIGKETTFGVDATRSEQEAENPVRGPRSRPENGPQYTGSNLLPENESGGNTGNTGETGRGSGTRGGKRGSDSETGGNGAPAGGREPGNTDTGNGSTTPLDGQRGENASGTKGAKGGKTGGNTRGQGVAGGTDTSGVDRGAGNGSPKPRVIASQGQTHYTPVSGGGQIGTLTPQNMAVPIQNSLDSLAEKHGSVDNFVQTMLQYDTVAELHQALSAEQIDAVALAMDNMQKGSGFVLGDQTGIGKGRVVASMIRYAYLNGKVPVFITEKQGLYSDMYRDLIDIGMKPSIVDEIMQTNSDNVMLYNNDSTGEKVELVSPTKWNQTLAEVAGMPIIGKGKNAKQKKIVFTTYDQMNVGASEGAENLPPRRKFLRQLVSQGNVMLIMDESHNAGGSGDLQNLRPSKRTGITPYPRALFFRHLIGDANGVIYSSATYAKNPEVMSLYSATDLRLGVGGDINALAQTVTSGGIPFQQITASMLAESGQYIRRERSFDGVTYSPKTVKVDAVAAESVSSVMSAIRAFEESYMIAAFEEDGEALGSNAVGEQGEKAQNFTSLMHNIIDQMLLGLKVKPSVEMAIETLKKGQGENEQVVLTVSNTMGAFIEEYADAMNLSVGDEFNASFGDLLQRYLYKTRLYRTGDVDAKGNPIYYWKTDDEIGQEAAAVYNGLVAEIAGMDFASIPVSPVDYMLNELNKAGFPALEITGRALYVDYSSGKPILAQRPASERSTDGRTATIKSFNEGRNRAIILNRSGSTGISLHASERNPPAGRGKRTMFIVQAEKDINVHMQMLGRIHRTGQVVTPAYAQMVADIPAERKVAAVLVSKMASLNANTTADKESTLSDKSSVDFLNKYGDRVAASLLRNNQEINYQLGSPYGGAKSPLDGLMKKVTGRLPLLPLAQQETIYNAMTEAYTDMIAELDATGRNDLEAKTFDLDAKTIEEKEISPATGTSPFQGRVVAERVDMKRIGKPYSSAELTTMLEENKGMGEEDAEKALGEFDQYEQATLDSLQTKIDEAETEAVRTLAQERLDKKRSELRLNRSRFNELMPLFRVGSTLEVSIDMGIARFDMDGIVVGMVKGGASQNPLALSSWRVRIAVADGLRIVNLPFSRFNAGRQDGEFDDSTSIIVTRLNDPIEDVKKRFDTLLENSREERWMITGNLFTGYSVFREANGRIINYTKADGTVTQGILMPAAFDPQAQLDRTPVSIETSSQALRYMEVVGNSLIHLRLPGELRIVHSVNGGDTYRVITHGAVSKGGRFFRDDRQLLEITGPFTSSSQRMVSEPLSKDDVAKVFDLFSRRGNTWFAKDSLDIARGIINGSAESNGQPKLSQTGKGTTGTTVSQGEQELGRYNRNRVTIVQSVGELPDNVKFMTADQQQRGQIQGAFNPNSGRVYLVADNIPSGQWRSVLEHEGFHRGVATGKLDELLNELGRMEQVARAGGKISRWFEKAREAAQVDRGKPHYIEELGAYAVAQYEQSPLVIRRWVDRLVAQVRLLLRQVIGPRVGLTPAMLRELAIRGLKVKSVQAQGTIKASSAAPEFKPVDPNSPELKRWLGNSQITEPIYHGSPKEFWTFDKNKIGEKAASPGAGLGFFFATDKTESAGYAGPGGSLHSFYVKVENPKRMNASSLPKFREVDEAQAYAKRQQLAGYDSIVLEDEGHVIVFEPNQVKSAELNTGEFSPDNTDVRYSVAAPGTLQPAPAWETPPDSKRDNFIYSAQDKLIDLKRIQDRIEKDLGPIQEEHDVRMAEELYHKRSAKRIEDMLVSEVNPLMEELSRLPGADMSEFEEYMHALHAPEANESLRLRNPNEAELKALKAQAKDEREQLQQSPTVQRYLEKEREMTVARHDVEMGEADDSLISVIQREIDSLEDEYAVVAFLKARERDNKLRHAKPYKGDNTALSGMSNDMAETVLSGITGNKKVLYRRLSDKWQQFMARTRSTLVQYELEGQDTVDSWAESFNHYVPLHREDMDNGMGIGQGFSVKGSSTRSRTGSNRKVVDILAHIVMQREKAIVRGEKALISKALYGLASANPNPEVWTIETPPTVRDFDPVTGLVVTRPDPTYKNKPNAVVHRFVNKKGHIEERAVLFNERSERGMRLAEALKNLDTEQLGTVLRASAVLTRWFSAINTQYNLVFGPVNAIRDAGAALLHLSDTQLAGRQKQVAKRIATSIKPLFKAIWAEAAGKPATTAIGKAWKEMQLAGGTTGFRDMFEDADARGKELKAAMLAPNTLSKARKRFQWAKKQVSMYNDVLENVSRLAVFMEAKEVGLSVNKAASLAKNITLNFNRKGKVATQAGALYAFFNASMQGTAKMYQTMTGPAGKKILAGGMILGASQAVLLAAAGFGDDEPPEFIKERSIIIPIGNKKYLTIPMPLGFNIIPNVARVSTEWILSGGENTGERVTNLIGSFAEVFNPIGNAGLSVQTLAPTVIDPLVALGENRDWTGKPIAKQNFNTLKPTPGHERMKDTASSFGIGISRVLNMLSGGTEYTPGLLSPTPDQIDYLIGQTFGGVGRESMKALQAASSTMTGEELPAYKIPLVSRFYGDSADSSSTSTAFYRNLKRMNMHALEIDGLRENRGDVRGYLAKNPEAKYVRTIEETYRRLQRMQKTKRALLKRDADRERVARIDDSIKTLMHNFNTLVSK